MVVNPSGKVTVRSELHPLKAYWLRVFTASGMTISCKLMQPKKATVKVVCGNAAQSCEILQFGEADDIGLEGEFGVQVGDGCRLCHTEFTIAAGVPVFHADGFHTVISEIDVLGVGC